MSVSFYGQFLRFLSVILYISTPASRKAIIKNFIIVPVLNFLFHYWAFCYMRYRSIMTYFAFCNMPHNF